VGSDLELRWQQWRSTLQEDRRREWAGAAFSVRDNRLEVAVISGSVNVSVRNTEPFPPFPRLVLAVRF
jgi:hypothetical protein